MAPEQARGGLVTAATDAGGSGGTLYAAATGVEPLPGAALVGYEQLDRAAVPCGGCDCGCTRSWPRSIDACLSAGPADRPGIVEVHYRPGSVLS